MSIQRLIVQTSSDVAFVFSDKGSVDHRTNDRLCRITQSVLRLQDAAPPHRVTFKRSLCGKL
jgi:bisphosphoglycerate-independent phosphoglycerate mutase (AlkP superfamily)